MNKRDYAVYLLGRLPEGKLDYVIAYLEGALIPDAAAEKKAPEMETQEAAKEMPEEAADEMTGMEDMDNMDFFDNPELTQEMLSGPLASLFRNTRAIQQQSDETDEIYAALERMAALGMEEDMFAGMEGLEGLEDLKDEEEEKPAEAPKNFFADAGLEGTMMSGPFAAMYKDAQEANQQADEDEEEFYSALERMARLELQAYKDGLK